MECQLAAPQPCQDASRLARFASRKLTITVCDITVSSSSATTVDAARDHDVIVDSQLTMLAHVNRSFTVAGPRLWNNLPHLSIYVTLNILPWSSAHYWRRSCFAEDSGA